MAYIILQDGSKFSGAFFGGGNGAEGEIVFYTAMAGYENVFTDPAFYGQIVVMTYPLIGNYGIRLDDVRQKSYVSAVAVREVCCSHSNWAADDCLESFISSRDICGISGVDTRTLTRKLRQGGPAYAIITDQLDALPRVKKGTDTAKVSTCAPYVLNSGADCSVAVVDLGLRQDIITALLLRGFEVKVYPHDTDAGVLLGSGAHAVVLSSGPGDPHEMSKAIQTARALAGKLPLLGIGLGSHILSLASGGEVRRLRGAHRGENIPVKDTITGRVYITSQNQSFTTVPETIKKAVVTHINWNDMTCDGMQYPQPDTFGVNFYPDTGSEQWGTGYIYDRLRASAKRCKENSAG